MPETVLVTGAAGFIGFHVARALLHRGVSVVGVDSLDDYGGLAIKEDRLGQLGGSSLFRFVRLDLAERGLTEELFCSLRGVRVVHLAAQPGVRYALENPHAYLQSNLVAFGNLLECCRRAESPHLVFASSSSVYGAEERLPFSLQSSASHPLSLYAATKRAGELMAHAYASLHGLPCTGLRLFSVYGPWGRTDMAPYLFSRAIMRGEPVSLFSGGRARRDLTYIDDVVEGVLRALSRPPAPDPSWRGSPSSSFAPFRLYNLGSGQPVEMLRVLTLLETLFGRTAQKILLPAQPGEMGSTQADTSALARDLGFTPGTTLEEGLGRYVEWFRGYYGEAPR